MGRQQLQHTVILALVVGISAAAADAPPPTPHVFASPGGVELSAYVFTPSKPAPENKKKRPAIVLFHGGGWYVGEPAWAFARAKRFADLGMVAVAAQYRLSDQKGGTTPLEAMADARAVIRWMREHAGELGIDRKRIAAYGWSAGGHLAASAALFDDPGKKKPSAVPDALVLICPAVALEKDTWVQKLLGDKARARDISPDAHVRGGLPPTLILQAGADTVTPSSGAQRFCERLTASGNTCHIHIYEGFGHMFTPAGVADDGMPQPDAATADDAARRAERFLSALGFIDK